MKISLEEEWQVPRAGLKAYDWGLAAGFACMTKRNAVKAKIQPTPYGEITSPPLLLK